MTGRMARAVCCLFGIPFILNGCGGGGSSPTPSPTPAPSSKGPTTVFMMRHCIRQIPEQGMFADPAFSYFNNYSSQPWKPFDKPAFYCLDRGEKIVEEQGAWLKKNGNVPLPLSVKADTCERDNVTGHALLRGMGLTDDQYTFESTHDPFSDGTESQACVKPSDADKAKAVEAQLQRYPMPADHEQMKAKLLSILGTGAAGDWTKQSCGVAPDASKHPWAALNGSCNVADEVTERFLMEWGGGFVPGFGKVDINDIPKLLALHSWYLTVALFQPEVAKVSASPIAGDILDFLESGTKGTRAFVGHDTQQGLLSAALGLSWDPSPFPVNATLPGSIIRFDREDQSDTVSISYVFVENFTAGGEMKSVPAIVAGAPDGKITLKAFKDLVEKGTTPACRPSTSQSGVEEFV